MKLLYFGSIILAATASGNMLPPSLILKRKSPYFLQCENGIDLCVMNSSNGWNNGDLTVKLIERILLPYIGNEQCLLIFVSRISPAFT